MAKTATRVRKKIKRNIASGTVNILASFNNTIVTISDPQGNVIAWATSGGSGFRGARKSTPFAAQVAGQNAGQKAREFGLKSVDVYIKGPGPGRESAVRALSNFFRVTAIYDITPLPHNGCKKRKARRV